MIRFALTSLLLVHGLIHGLGFLNQLHVVPIDSMSGKSLIPLSERVSKGLGVLWLVAGLGFGVAAITYWLGRERWLSIAFFSLLLSQLLIILYWSDAKAGTILNGVLAAILGLAYAQAHVERTADAEAQQLLQQPVTLPGVVTPAMTETLPTPVKNWLLASGVVGKERIHTVRLRQRGLMRTRPDGGWMPTEAEQYFSVDQPGFVWKADVRLFAFLPLAGRDKYANGKGNMLIKALSIVPVVNAADTKTDQGTMLRFLGEMCWFPSAALNPYITWKAVNETQAEATMTYKGVSAKALFTFDDQHRLVGVTANRYKGGGPEGKLETWHIPARAWKTLNGITIPVKGDVVWQLPTGDFTYYQWEIIAIDYNRPEVYERR